MACYPRIPPSPFDGLAIPLLEKKGQQKADGVREEITFIFPGTEQCCGTLARLKYSTRLAMNAHISLET